MKNLLLFSCLIVATILFDENNLLAQTPCTDVVIPDVFTPNNDGINDKLVITCLENFPENTLTIYSRWGEIIYQAEGYSNNWDGKAEKNKSDVPDGVYVFIFKVTMGGEEKSLTGSITITR